MSKEGKVILICESIAGKGGLGAETYRQKDPFLWKSGGFHHDLRVGQPKCIRGNKIRP